MGDFNYDVYRGQSNKLTYSMEKCKLSSALSDTISTTNFNTQIHIVCTNISNFSAGVYEMYFSDHNPIYFSIDKYDNETNKEIFTSIAKSNAQAKHYKTKEYERITTFN